MTTSLSTFSSTTSPAAAYSSRGSVTMHTRGPANPAADALVTTANMMMQTERAQRATTKARMEADEATKTALLGLQNQVKDLTTLVNQQGAKITALTEQRKQEKLVQNAMITEIREKVATLAAEVQVLQKAVELMKPAVRHYYITIDKHYDASGNLLDQHLQMLKPVMPPIRGTSRAALQSELERFLDWDKQETWRVGWKPRRF